MSWGDDALEDWVRRLKNPGMAFSNWFPAQNCVQKIGLRFLPSVVDCIAHGRQPSRLMAFGVAAIMRFLTPESGEGPPVEDGTFIASIACKTALERADTPLGYSMCDGVKLTYTWKSDIPEVIAVLAELKQNKPSDDQVASATAAFLALVPGAATDTSVYGSLVALVAEMYAQMLRGADPVGVLSSALQSMGKRSIHTSGARGRAVKQKTAQAE